VAWSRSYSSATSRALGDYFDATVGSRRVWPRECCAMN